MNHLCLAHDADIVLTVRDGIKTVYLGNYCHCSYTGILQLVFHVMDSVPTSYIAVALTGEKKIMRFINIRSTCVGSLLSV